MDKPKWLLEKAKELEKCQFLEFYKLKEGENLVDFILQVEPRPNEYQDGDRAVSRQVYRIQINQKAYDFPVSTQLEKLIIQALTKDINPMTIIREGTGLETRYSIKELV